MKAAVLHAVGEPLDVTEVDLDACGPHEVRLRTEAAGLCHSDLSVMTGAFAPWAELPAVLGHESAGVIVEVGEAVTYVRPGDRVMTHGSSFCGNCTTCLSGHSHMCHHMPEGIAVLRRPAQGPPRASLADGGAALSCHAELGSFAEEMLVHENAVVKIDDDIPFEIAAILGCGVTTGLGAALHTARVTPASTVAVVGCGGVGLATIQGALLAGARRVIAIDISAERLERAAALGATDVVDASRVDSVAAVHKLSGGGVEYSFDAAGADQTAERAFSMLAMSGTCTVVGAVISRDLRVPGALLQMERKIQGCIMGSSSFRVDIPRWLEFYRQGRLKLDDFVSDRIRLDQVNEGFAAMQRGEGARNVIVFD